MTIVRRRGMVKSGRRLLGGSSLRRMWRKGAGGGADLTSRPWLSTALSTSGGDSRKVTHEHCDVCSTMAYGGGVEGNWSRVYYRGFQLSRCEIKILMYL